MSENNSAAQRNFFPALRNAAVASCGLLGAATFLLHLAPWIASVAALLPLLWYHRLYLAPRAKVGLSQAAIDSVYYLGFLVTIAALGVSAISLALAGANESTESIAFQFGLGLLATGYAVYARMHLTSVSTWVDEQGPEAVLDRYLKRTQELVTNVEMASVQFSSLSSNLMAQSEAVSRHAAETTEKTMLAMAKAFDEQMRSTLSSGTQGLSELRALVSETSFVEEREALAKSMKFTLETMLALNKSLQEFGARAAENARATQASSAATDTLAGGLSRLSTQIEGVAGDDGTIVRTARNFAEVQSSATLATASLRGVVQEFDQIGGAIGGVGTTFKNLKTLTSKAQSQLEALVETSQQLDAATALLGRSAERTGALAKSIDEVSTVIPQMGGEVVQLSQQLSELRQTTSAVEQSLHALPRPADAAIVLTGNLREAFGEMRTVIAGTSDQVRALTETVIRQVDHSNQLTSEVTKMSSSASTVRDMLSGIAESAAKANDALGKSTSTMQKSIEAATGALERDVQTSSRAASLFSEKLAQVADHIIDETRKARMP